MSVLKESTKLTTSNISSLVGTGAGFDLMRYYTLPDFLGKDAPYLLYYMGKNMARQTEMETFDELYEFFQYMGWGELVLIHDKKKEMLFHLKGHIIEKRLHQKLFPVDFRLECGFLSEMIQAIAGDTYECFEELDKKQNLVEIKALKG
ncbi:YslB family protein [Halobacillus sp. ACCC02827]|uniref:YslB family protein n=1 Tax=Bacillaceae TaxID=186817 RepID=UPI0004208464|nr:MULTISPECIES: YslB family protein [Bacillaceae]QHT47352.1 YslB family protein [Bacillus sp. SB49]WJE14575.1 YslB family protein [Halobacillus sp. ACCC02827]